MPKIKVEQPFTVRMEGESHLHSFTVGEHNIDDDVLKHWFVQACLKDGRALLVAETQTEKKAEDTPPTYTEAQLLALANARLIQMAKARGLEADKNATKAQLVAMLLGGQ